MKLTIVERTKLLGLLPQEGNILTLKILRKLRESLSFSEAELKTFNTTHEYMCPYRGEEDNTLVICDNKGFFLEQPTCCRHNIPMLQTGQMNLMIPPEALKNEKEIHMGTQAFAIASAPLKALNEANPPKLTDDLVSLYDKFFPPEEKEE